MYANYLLIFLLLNFKSLSIRSICIVSSFVLVYCTYFNKPIKNNIFEDCRTWPSLLVVDFLHSFSLEIPDSHTHLYNVWSANLPNVYILHSVLRSLMVYCGIFCIYLMAFLIFSSFIKILSHF